MSFIAQSRECPKLNMGLLSSDLETRRSQLYDIMDDCPSLSVSVQLAKVYQQLGESDTAEDVMLDSLDRDLKNNQDRATWLVASIELALQSKNTCQVSKYLNELSVYNDFKNTYKQFRKKLYELTKNTVVDSATIGCALTVNRSVTVRSMQLKPKLDLAIHFNFNSDVLTSKGRNQAQQLAKALLSGKLQNKNISLIGHTDSIGTAKYNMGLSQRRALSVQNFLVSYNASLSSRLSAVGKGETELLSSGTSDYDHQLNRRVEIQTQ